MDQMYCKVCGYQSGAGETACPECGAPLHPVESAPPDPETSSQTGAAPKKKTEKRPLGPKAALVRRVACLLAVCLALQVLGLWSLSWRGRENNWSVAWWGSDLVTPQGVWRVGENVWSVAGDSRHPQKLLRAVTFSDAVAPVRGGDQLYYYDGHTLKDVDWQAGTISDDGQVLFYLRREGEETVLYRQDLTRGPARAVDRAKTSGPGVGIISAWDGSAAVWRAANGVNRSQPVLRQWDRERGGVALDGERDANIRALGRGGNAIIERVHAVGVNEYAWSVVLRWGQREIELGSSDGVGLEDPIVDWELIQILYRQNGRYWYLESDKDPVAVTGLPEDDFRLDPLVPAGNDPYIYGYSFSPVPRLTDWVYKGSTGHLYYLDDGLTATDLTPGHRVRDYVMDETGTTLYWSSANGGLFRIDDPGPDAVSVQIEERSGWELDAAPDLSTVGYLTWVDGKSTYAFLDTRTGARTVLTGEKDRTWVLLNGGCCWRLEDGALWFWSGTAGERQVSLDKLEDKEKKLSQRHSDFRVVGDGAQAVLRLNADLIYYGDLNGAEADDGLEYWLLDDRGNATKLETLDYAFET